jgi:hypothetical protein
MPVATMTDPTTAMTLYLPRRDMSCPLAAVPKTTPIIIGIIMFPDCVADAPSTP